MLNFVFIGVLILVVVSIAGFIVLKDKPSKSTTTHSNSNESSPEGNEEDTE